MKIFNKLILFFLLFIFPLKIAQYSDFNSSNIDFKICKTHKSVDTSKKRASIIISYFIRAHHSKALGIISQKIRKNKSAFFIKNIHTAYLSFYQISDLEILYRALLE